MEDKRKHSRHSTELKAQYRLEEENWKECTVMNLSEEGMGIKIPTREKVSLGSTIQLKVILPEELKIIDAEGTVRWIKEDDDGGLICGFHL